MCGFGFGGGGHHVQLAVKLLVVSCVSTIPCVAPNCDVDKREKMSNYKLFLSVNAVYHPFLPCTVIFAHLYFRS